MLKKLLIGLAAFAGLLLLALTYITARFVDREAILAAQTEAKVLRESRDSIIAFAALRDSMQADLRGSVTRLENVAGSLRTRVHSIEEQRAAGQLAVRRIDNSDTLAAIVRTAFPEVAAALRKTTVHDPVENVSIEYFMIPLWFAETFVVNDLNARLLKVQRDTLLVLDSVRTVVSTLQDSILSLEQQKSLAFKAGFDSAFASFQGVNAKYIALLERPPQLKLGLPAWTTIVGSAGVGFLVGVLAK